MSLDRRARLLLAGLSLLLATEARGQERTLHWRQLGVNATLEKTSALRVTERHEMVWSGAWNGGERRFDVRPGQRIDLLSVTRVDPRTGATRRLTPSTDPSIGLDQYTWSSNLLRWRARRPSDPPFRNAEAVYLVEYRAHGVLGGEGKRFVLQHDFAFRDRPGAIQRFTLDLAFEPGWKPAPGLAFPLERSDLRPGQGAAVTVPLEWTGPGVPAPVVAAPPRPVLPVAGTAPPVDRPPPAASMLGRLAALGSFLGLLAALAYGFVRREEGAGSFGAPPEITMEWLEAHVFRHRPEVIGAAWDGETGNAEAAALIATLVAEGKIANAPGNLPRLTLLVDRATLPEYERRFVDRLFVDGEHIDPETLRRHYQDTGFDPASAIRLSVAEAAQAIVHHGSALNGAVIGLVLTLFVVLPLAASQTPVTAGMATDAALAIAASIAFIAVHRSQFQGRLTAAAIALPFAVLAFFLARAAVPLAAIGIGLAIALFSAVLALVGASSRGLDPEHQANLRALRAAREFFRRRLRRGADIEERWVPYVLGFGLGGDLDRWSVERPRREEPVADRYRSDPPAPMAPGAPRAEAPYEPGGGSFGGAGATGAWAASIGQFAVEVASPRSASSADASSSSWSSSSSESSVSSDSSDSRSGGGGGGAW